MASGPMPIEDAPAVGRRLLGALLAQRRKELGYTHWPAFARDKLPLTPKGNPNTRMLADIEKAYRKRFPEPTLRQLARAYQVTYKSLLDVAHLRYNALVPALPGDVPPAIVPSGPPGWMAADEKRSAANEPYADEIKRRLAELRAQGILNPSGAQLFGEGTADAGDWDAYADWGIRDRVWFIADLQRLTRGGREGNSGTGA